MKRVWLVTSILALTVVLSGAAPAQTAVVDHFRCYLIPQQPVLQVPLQLQDQFDAAMQMFENINTLTIVRLCNPVRKTVNGIVTPIVNVNHHLTMFQINTQPIISRTVVVSNQFGSNQTLHTADAQILAVPTGKAIQPNPPPPPSTDLDHYKCYVASGPPVNVTATLSDQFTTETVQAFQPVLFCNPVEKIHGGVVTPIQHPLVHLTCYATSASNFPGIGVNITNQIVSASLRVAKPDLLCLPSQKLQWSVTTATAKAPSSTTSARR